MASSSGDYYRRLEQQRAEAHVFPPRGTRHTRNHGGVVAEYPIDDSNNATRIGSIGVTVLEKKAQQAAYAKSITDDRESSARILAQENTGSSNAYHHRSVPRKQPTDTAALIDEVNILSGIGANESDYLTDNGKERRKNQQMDYASQLQRQQETQELYRADEQRRLDSLRRGVPQQSTEYHHQQPQHIGPAPAPRRRIATPGGPRGSEASYYDLGGDGSGMLASFGADPNAEASKKREMRSQYAKQLQEQRQQEQQQQQQHYHHQQPSDGGATNMSSSNAAHHQLQQQQQQQQPYHPSSSSHSDASSYDTAAAGYDYGYDTEHQGGDYHHNNSNNHNYNHNNNNNQNHSNSNNSNSYNPAANIANEQEQKRRQQKKYHDEIALAAAAAPIRRDRLPVQRDSTPKNMRRPPGAADVLQGTGTGLQIGGGVGIPSSSVNAYAPGGGGMGGVVSRGKITVLDPDAADSRARRYHQQQEYARQLDSDAAVNPYPEEPSSAYHSGRRSGGGSLRRTGNGASNEPDVNPYSGYGYRRNDNGYSISKDQGVFGPHVTEEEIAAQNTAKKRASQQEYRQQLEEFESSKVRSAANTANLARLSLYRAQQLQKEQEQKNLAYGATIRYQGESPLTPSKNSVASQSRNHNNHDDSPHHRSSYEQGLEHGRNRDDTPYQDTSGQDTADDDGQQPYPYEDRRTLSGRGGGRSGGAGRSSSGGMSRREPDPIDAQINTHRRQQQKQYHIALENDAKIVPPKPSYTALPRKTNATRELDERDYPYRLHGNANGSSSYMDESTAGGQSSAGHPIDDSSSSSSHRQYSHRGLGYSESLHQPGRDAYDGNVRAQIRSRAGTIAGVINGYEGGDVANPYPNRARAAAADYGGGSDPSMALPSYRSTGQQGGGGGGYTPQTNGSTPGGSSSGPALVYSNKTAAAAAAATATTSASKQYLFGTAGGPSVGAPSHQAQGLAQPQSDYSYGGGAHAAQQSSSSFAHGAKGPSSYAAYSSTPNSGGASSSRGFQSTGSVLSSRQPPQGQGLGQDHLNNMATNSNTYYPVNVLNSGRSAGASSRARGSSFMLQ